MNQHAVESVLKCSTVVNVASLATELENHFHRQPENPDFPEDFEEGLAFLSLMVGRHPKGVAFKDLPRDEAEALFYAVTFGMALGLSDALSPDSCSPNPSPWKN
ncbi:MAG: hypothetical protein ACRCXD_08725 [Luteolibacter sp.]